MKPPQTNLKLVISIYVCDMNGDLPVVDSSSKYVMLTVISKYFLFCNFETT